MKQSLLIYLLVFCCSTAFSQTGVLTGSVIDSTSKTPLELATISVFQADSSLITYKLSDKDGKFVLDKLPLRKKLLVSVTYTGYIAHHTSIELAAGKPDTLHLLLAYNNKDTNSVVVTARVPIRMNGDTLEINPGAFKLKPDAVAEELLNQVPGITIWSDGTITVDGKKVENLLVDGKPFLGSTDTRIATQNLPKSAIDKIQLYREYDRSNINQTAPPKDSTLTMNIKLKESSKKGYFGKAGAGYGTDQRFESDLSFQMYNKRSSAGIGGGINNINKNIGNLQEMFQNNTYRNYNPNLYNVGRFGTAGINKNHSIGGVVTHSFIESANSRQNDRITVTYNKSGTDTYITNLSLENRTTINNPQFIRAEGVQNNRGDKHDLSVTYLKTNSYNDNLDVKGAANSSNDRSNSSDFTEVRDSVNQLQSTNRSATVQQRRSDSQTLTANFATSDEENPIKNINISVDARRGSSVSDREVTSVFQSFVDPSQSTSYNRRYSTNSSSNNVGGTIDYSGFKRLLLRRYNLFGIGLNLSQRLNYSSQTDNNQVTDFDSTVKKYAVNDALTNRNKKELFEYSPSLVLSKTINKYTASYYKYLYVQVKLIDDFKTEKNTSSIVQRNLDRTFQFARYEGYLAYQYQKPREYMYTGALGYTKNFEYPTIDQLYTIVDDINVYNTRIGNPSLRNRINHTTWFQGNFNTQKPQAIYSINGGFNGSYTRSFNLTVDSTINDPSGRRISYYINGDKSSSVNLNYNFNISRKLKSNTLQLMYNGRFNSDRFPNYIDGRYNTTAAGTIYNSVALQFSLKSLLVLDVTKSLQYYKSTQTAAGLTSFKNSNNNTRLGAVLNYPKNFTFSSTLDNIYNSNIDKPTNLWNAFVTYRFMKQQAELKFSAMDILKQYKNISNYFNAYGTTTRITNGLQQYFLVTFSFYPRKFGKTESKRQNTNAVTY